MHAKKIIIPVAFIMLPVYSAFACNQCGCQSSVGYTGLLNYSNSNFISLQYMYSGMHTSDSITGGDVMSEYASIMVTGGVQLFSGKWSMQYYIPFAMNQYQDADADLFKNSGLGDAGWINHFQILKSNDTSNAFWNLFLKAGIEFPTGNFYSTYREDDVPATISTGSDSWDIMTGLRFSYSKNNLGIYGNYLFKYNTENAEHYTYGNQHIATALASYKFMAGNSTITPLIGVIAEFIDYNTFYGYDQHGTSGNNIFATSGLDFNLGNLNMGCNFDLPVYSKYDNMAKSTLRGSVHIGFSF